MPGVFNLSVDEAVKEAKEAKSLGLGGIILFGLPEKKDEIATGAWAEDGWSGHEVAIGSAALRVVSPVPRCVVTTRNPESGATDARILHALAELRGRDNINFGVWCDIARPGQVQVGDLLTPPAALAAS